MDLHLCKSYFNQPQKNLSLYSYDFEMMDQISWVMAQRT